MTQEEVRHQSRTIRILAIGTERTPREDVFSSYRTVTLLDFHQGAERDAGRPLCGVATVHWEAWMDTRCYPMLPGNTTIVREVWIHPDDIELLYHPLPHKQEEEKQQQETRSILLPRGSELQRRRGLDCSDEELIRLVGGVVRFFRETVAPDDPGAFPLMSEIERILSALGLSPERERIRHHVEDAWETLFQHELPRGGLL